MHPSPVFVKYSLTVREVHLPAIFHAPPHQKPAPIPTPWTLDLHSAEVVPRNRDEGQI